MSVRRGRLAKALTSVPVQMRDSASKAAKRALRGWYVHSHKGKRYRNHLSSLREIAYEHEFKNCYPSSIDVTPIVGPVNLQVTFDTPPPPGFLIPLAQ